MVSLFKGYGSMSGPNYPFMKINNSLVNTTGATYSGGFGSNNTNKAYGLPSPASNKIAASGKWTGGAKRTRRRFKKTTLKRKRRRQRGGNCHTPGASVAGRSIPNQQSMLANPPLIYRY